MKTDTLRADHGPVGGALDLTGTQKRPIHSASGTRTEESMVGSRYLPSHGSRVAATLHFVLPGLFFLRIGAYSGMARSSPGLVSSDPAAVAPRLCLDAGAAIVPPRTGSTSGVAENEPTDWVT